MQRARDMIRYWVRSLFHGRQMDADLQEELRDHLARETAARVAQGNDAAAAHRAAAVQLGGVTRFAEEARDARGGRWLRDAGTDLRHALRLLRRYPGFSLATIVIAALGIGSTTVVFSAVNGVLIRPLPFVKPDQLAVVQLTGGEGRFAGSGFDQYTALTGQPQLVTAAGIYGLASFVALRNGEPEHVRAEYLSPSALDLLGVHAAIGRFFTDDDVRGGERVVLLSHSLWQQWFGGDPHVVGKSLMLDGATATVIGVMAPDFHGPRLLDAAVWVPARLDGGYLSVNGARQPGGSILVRLHDGVSPTQAGALLSALIHPRVFDPATRDSVAGHVRVQALMDVVILDRAEPLLVLLGAVGFVLLLVAANIATLSLARASAREREMAVRRALGASRSRHIRQVLTETLLLTGIGGLLGVALARIGLFLFVNAGVDLLPRVRDITIDGTVLVAAGTLTLIAALLAGIAPALTASRVVVGDAFKSAGGGVRKGRLRSVLVSIEIAVSVVLLVGAGLLIKGFLRVAPTAPGFALDHRVVLPLNLNDVGATAADTATNRRAFVANVSRRFGAVAGIREVALSSIMPLTGTSAVFPVQPEGAPPARRMGHQRAITPNFLSVMRIPVVAGRAFTDQDDEGAIPVAIVNQTAAARWWPGVQPLGRTLSFSRGRGGGTVTLTVVGIAGDVRFTGTDTSHTAEFYTPYAQGPTRYVNVLAVTTGDPRAMIPELKRQIWAVDPKLPIDNAATLDEIAGDSVSEERLYLVMMAVFAAIALVLAAAGIFSVVAYAVSQRTREIGIRLALGAPRVRVGGMVVRQGAVIASTGFVVGVVAALGLTRFMRSLLLEVSPTDTGVFVGTVVALALIVLLACAIPTRRALAVDPAISLRTE